MEAGRRKEGKQPAAAAAWAEMRAQPQQAEPQVHPFKSQCERADVGPSGKRYLILLLFCLHSMINALQWIYLSSITPIVADYYQVDNMAVNWTSMVYMLAYVTLIVPASWLFERLGLRRSILLGSLGTSAGSLIKCFSFRPDQFALLMTGQAVVAVSQLFVLSVPPRLAALWFPDHQVGLANACGVMGNQLGVALGFVVPQLVMQGGAGAPSTAAATERALFRMFLGVALVSGLTTLLILLFLEREPARPPGLARLQQMRREEAAAAAAAAAATAATATLVEPLAADSGAPMCVSASSPAGYARTLARLLREPNFLLLMASYGLNVGVSYALSTLLSQMLEPRWPAAGPLTGRLGLVMVLAGMLGSMLCGLLLDRTRLYRLVNLALYLLSLAALLVFAGVLETAHSRPALYLTVGLLGYAMTGYLLIGLELSNEITWPLPESLAAGLLNLSAQVFGVALTYAGSRIVDRHGGLPANLFFAANLVAGALATLLIKAPMKRQSAMGP